jgi:hypothetical protein
MIDARSSPRIEVSRQSLGPGVIVATSVAHDARLRKTDHDGAPGLAALPTQPEYRGPIAVTVGRLHLLLSKGRPSRAMPIDPASALSRPCPNVKVRTAKKVVALLTTGGSRWHRTTAKSRRRRSSGGPCDFYPATKMNRPARYFEASSVSSPAKSPFSAAASPRRPKTSAPAESPPASGRGDGEPEACLEHRGEDRGNGDSTTPTPPCNPVRRPRSSVTPTPRSAWRPGCEDRHGDGE